MSFFSPKKHLDRITYDHEEFVEKHRPLINDLLTFLEERRVRPGDAEKVMLVLAGIISGSRGVKISDYENWTEPLIEANRAMCLKYYESDEWKKIEEQLLKP